MNTIHEGEKKEANTTCDTLLANSEKRQALTNSNTQSHTQHSQKTADNSIQAQNKEEPWKLFQVFYSVNEF